MTDQDLISIKEAEEAVLQALFAFAEESGLDKWVEKNTLFRAISTQSGKKVTLGRIHAAIISLDAKHKVYSGNSSCKLRSSMFAKMAGE